MTVWSKAVLQTRVRRPGRGLSGLMVISGGEAAVSQARMPNGRKGRDRTTRRQGEETTRPQDHKAIRWVWPMAVQTGAVQSRGITELGQYSLAALKSRGKTRLAALQTWRTTDMTYYRSDVVQTWGTTDPGHYRFAVLQSWRGRSSFPRPHFRVLMGSARLLRRVPAKWFSREIIFHGCGKKEVSGTTYHNQGLNLPWLRLKLRP